MLTRRQVKKNANMVVLVLGLICSLFLQSFLINNTFAADTITISITNPTISLDITSATAAGNFAESTASTINASTDGPTGYTLSIISPSDNTTLTNTSDSSKTITSISSALSASDFKDSSNTTYNNKWGYKPSTIYDTSTQQTTANTNFRPLPGSTGEIIAKTSSANASGTSDSYTLSFGARVNNSTTLGTYTNDTFVVTAISNFVGLTINYNANNGHFGSDTSVTTNSVIYDASCATSCSKTTYSGEYSRPISNTFGSFLGWSENSSATTATYVDEADVAANLHKVNGDPDVTLYAIWNFDIQNWTGCIDMSTGDTTTLKDTRDNDTYLVGKLADGRCWMLENLRLGSTSSMTLNGDSTNMARGTTYTLPASSTANFTTSGGYTTGRINSQYKNSTTTKYGIGSGKRGTYYNFCAAMVGTWCESSTSTAQPRTDFDVCPIGWNIPRTYDESYPNEYNNLYTSYSSNATASDSGSIQYNLSLPLSGYFANGSFSDVGTKAVFWQRWPVPTNYGWGNELVMNVSFTSSAFEQTWSNDYIYNYRYAGNPVRCINKQPYTFKFDANGGSGTMADYYGDASSNSETVLPANTFTRSGYYFVGWTETNKCGDTFHMDKDIISYCHEAGATYTLHAQWAQDKTSTYMQDYTKSQCAADASNGWVAIKDRRDNQIYTVRYINGNCWMTRDIAIGCNGSGYSYGGSVSRKYLTSTYSNVSSGWYTPTDLLTTQGNNSGYSKACMSCHATYGAHYNYMAATAGTISGDNNTTEATKDICPRNWHLPSKTQGETLQGHKIEYAGQAVGTYYWQPILKDFSFGPYAWTSTDKSEYSGGQYRYNISANTAVTNDVSINYSSRYYGIPVRCIRDT